MEYPPSMTEDRARRMFVLESFIEQMVQPSNRAMLHWALAELGELAAEEVVERTEAERIEGRMEGSAAAWTDAQSIFTRAFQDREKARALRRIVPSIREH